MVSWLKIHQGVGAAPGPRDTELQFHLFVRADLLHHCCVGVIGRGQRFAWLNGKAAGSQPSDEIATDLVVIELAFRPKPDQVGARSLLVLPVKAGIVRPCYPSSAP
jgi:hypothetical protein